jgi:hypothetical protein
MNGIGIQMGRRRYIKLEDVENCLRELKVNRWRQKANNREEWAFVAEEDKILKGQLNHGVII